MKTAAEEIGALIKLERSNVVCSAVNVCPIWQKEVMLINYFDMQS